MNHGIGEGASFGRDENMGIGASRGLPLPEVMRQCGLCGLVQRQHAVLAKLCLADNEPVAGDIIDHQVHRLRDAHARRGKEPEQRVVGQRPQ